MTTFEGTYLGLVLAAFFIFGATLLVVDRLNCRKIRHRQN